MAQAQHLVAGVFGKATRRGIHVKHVALQITDEDRLAGVFEDLPGQLHPRFNGPAFGDVPHDGPHCFRLAVLVAQEEGPQLRRNQGAILADVFLFVDC